MTRTLRIITRNYRFTFFQMAIGALICVTLYSTAAVAQMTLNTTFNAGVTDGNSQGFTSAVQPDGKILVGGSYTFANGTEQASLIRLNTNGTTDTTFNTGGLGPSGVVYDIKVLPDGKIIIGGGFTTYNGTAITGLARLNSNGTLDTTFNTGGVGTVGTVQNVTIQMDGKYLISGSNLSSYNATAKFSVIRVNVDGTLDTAFTSPFTTAQFVEQTGVQTDGKIVIGGIFTIIGYNNIARLTATGAIDTTFNVGGTGSNGGVYAVFVLPDNRILAGGDFTSYNGTARQGGARLTSDGALDTTFVPPAGLDFSAAEYVAVKPNGQYVIAGAFVDIDGGFPVAQLNTDGTVDATFTPPQADNTGYHVTLQADGKILLAGWFNNVEGLGGLTHRNLVRLNVNGTVDTGFTCAFNAFGSVTAMLQQTDGKYVIAGNFNSANAVNHSNIARFNSDGTIDNSFQSGFGLFSTGFVAANALAQQTDGKLLLGGVFFQYNTNDARSMVRLNADGTQDVSFQPIGISAGFPTVSDLLIQPDGKIMVAGSGLDINFQTLVRLNANGTGDGTFVPGNANGTVQKVLRQADGKLIVVGSFNSYGGGTRNRIVRLNADGTIDGTFNVGTGTNATISMAVFQPDGKILIGGLFTTFNGTTRNRIARLNADGSLDTTFNPPSGANGSIGAIIVQSAGKIVISGGFTTYDGMARVRFARINANGSLDTSADSGVVNNFRFGIRRLMLTTDNELLVGGIFNTYFGTPRNSLAKLKLTGPKAPFDFDGDGKTDVSIFRPPVGEWWYQRSSDLQVRAGQFGAGTDKITPGDFTGDGKTDLAFWRPSSGEWFVLRSEDSSFFSFPFGTTGDVPMPADYDGDGRTDAAVFRPSSATWFILNSGGSGTGIVNFGTSGDKPVAADYDGDGKADIAIVRPSDGSWWYLRSSDTQVRVFQFGVSTDRPVQGDFTGDGKADIAVWRPSTGFWFVQRSEDGSFFSFPFGANGDIPTPGDYDGDGKFDAAVFRPSSATWFILRSATGPLFINFGSASDQPVPSAFVQP
jgi:uncharacterized delta-60 repeat protein